MNNTLNLSYMIRKFSPLLTIVTALSASAAAWMSELPDFRRIRQMSIPVAHDAATSSVSGLYSKCQYLTIAQQWDKGVRATSVPAYKVAR
ncbi:MAG: hypothetical protein HDS75_04265 [Bacteroidales bacterium]|nr:hypothetical protein [Bacteroidales bacterium]